MTDPYADYSVDDFLQDAYFYEWVRFPTPEHDDFWQSWLIRHPEKRETVERAQSLLKSIVSNEKQPPPHFKTEDWSEIQRRIAGGKSSKTFQPHIPRPKRSLKIWAGTIAASVVLGLCIGITIYLNDTSSSEWISLQTQYGEQQTIILPDKSEVVLNGNSTLRYSTNWGKKAGHREVWLEGEGFFSVTKQHTGSISDTSGLTKFTVHANELNVEVRGTQFNVQSRSEKTRVVLSEGQVLVRNGRQDSMLLRPNELAESTLGYLGLRRKTVDASHYISWKNHVLTFSEEPVKNILDQLQNTYGWKVDVQDSSWLEHRYTGSVPTDRIELLFEKFSLLYELDITLDEQQVVIK